MKITYQGSCHCRRFRFEVHADINHVRVCDCSICHMRGAFIFRVPNDAVRLLTPLGELTCYQWGTMTAEDYFCPVCGILPLRRPRHRSQQEARSGATPFDGWSVNTRCLEGFDADSVPRTTVHGSRLPLP
jgi:hypothetical protein